MNIAKKNESQIKLEGSSVADEMALLWTLAGLIIIFLKLYFSPTLSVQLSCQRTETKDMTATAQCLVKEYWFWGLYKRNEMLVEYVSRSNIEIKEEIVRQPNPLLRKFLSFYRSKLSTNSCLIDQRKTRIGNRC